MSDNSETAGRRPAKPDWFLALATYERKDGRKVIRQMLETFPPYLALCVLMLHLVTHGYPYWITLFLSVLAAGFLIRSFIFLHDCSHGSYFSLPHANTILGYIVGTLTMTPFEQWRWTHLKHHSSFANLDRRGVGDIELMTVEEYLAAPRLKRIAYRIYRHPLFMFGIGSTLLFALLYRFPIKGIRQRERFSVWLTDGAILAVVTAVSLIVGFRAYILVQAPVLFIAWTLGVWISIFNTSSKGYIGHARGNGISFGRR